MRNRVDWDGENMKVTNTPELNQWLKREDRKGWTVKGPVSRLTFLILSLPGRENRRERQERVSKMPHYFTVEFDAHPKGQSSLFALFLSTKTKPPPRSKTFSGLIDTRYE